MYYSRRSGAAWPPRRPDIMRAVAGLDVQHLEREGWAVLKGVVPPEVCARARACVDATLGPPGQGEVDIEMRGQRGGGLDAATRWPDPDGPPQLIPQGSPATGVRTAMLHPIRDSVVAELVVPVAPVFFQLYGCRRKEDLKLLQHMFVRTDAVTGAEQGVCSGPQEKHGWHMDDAFLEEHRLSTPMQSYYHCMLALTDVKTGGAPYLACPGSLRRARQIARELSPAERGLFDPGAGRTVLPGLILPQIDKEQPPVEVTMDEGDLLVHDPMLVHSGSANHGALPARYVLFSTFFDAAAIGTTLVGLPDRIAAAPATKFPREMRENLPAEWSGLLNWDLPRQQQRMQAATGNTQQSLEWTNGTARGVSSAKL